MRKLYVVDQSRLTVETFEIVKETPGRYYCNSLGQYGGYPRRFDKSALLSPNSRLFTDPVEALESLDGLIDQNINALQERRQLVAQNKEEILAVRVEGEDPPNWTKEGF
jgi:hypothetical protein